MFSVYSFSVALTLKFWGAERIVNTKKKKNEGILIFCIFEGVFLVFILIYFTSNRV